jgi:hypothetical protein
VEVSTIVKKLFAKNNGLPISLFKEPFFTDRLKLMNRQFGAYDKWMEFLKELEQFPNEQSYLEHNNMVRDKVINFIKQQKAYEELNQCDINALYPLERFQVRKHQVYRKENIGKTILSIDLKTANYTALRKFNPCLVANTQNYQEFISLFAKEDSIIHSKHLRQVIFGNLNNKRLAHIETYFIQQLVPVITKYFEMEKILSFVTDEVVIDITGCEEKIEAFQKDVLEKALELNIPLEMEKYVLRGITTIKKGEEVLTDFYMKDFQNGKVEFKGVPAIYYPMVLRAYYEEEVTESDLTFFHEGYVARFIEKVQFFIQK